MIKIKHFLEAVEEDDGQRLWIEPIGLTKDLCEWCAVNYVMPHLGPPMELWNWFQEHPDGYEYFRGNYHEHLGKSAYKDALQSLSKASGKETFTLLYDGDDSQHNTATALYEFIAELGAYLPPETT